MQYVSVGDAISREIVSNSLAHRDCSSSYVAKMVIERDRVLVENGNRAHGIGALHIRTLKPFPKNPPISKIFREIGLADELGSGMRNSYKYTRLYSGADPEFIEGDVFQIVIPLTTGSMTRVGPGTEPDRYPNGSSGQAGGQAEQAGQAGGQAEQAGHERGQAALVRLDVERLVGLLAYCQEPRTRAEMQEFCGIDSRTSFNKNILNPLLENGRLARTIPDKPTSPRQKYRWDK